jgi:hypothetical protein
MTFLFHFHVPMIPQLSVPSVFCLAYFASLYLYSAELLLSRCTERPNQTLGFVFVVLLHHLNLSHPTLVNIQKRLYYAMMNSRKSVVSVFVLELYAHLFTEVQSK